MKAKNQFIFLVYCNVEPIIYAVYKSEKAAIKYAKYLIKYRREMAAKMNYKFSFYHYMTPENFDYYINDEGKRVKLKAPRDLYEKDRFSACLKIEDNKKEFSENGCLVKIVRRLVQ